MYLPKDIQTIIYQMIDELNKKDHQYHYKWVMLEFQDAVSTTCCVGVYLGYHQPGLINLKDLLYYIKQLHF